MQVSTVDYMTTDVECRQLLDEALEYQVDVRRQPLLQSPRTQVCLCPALVSIFIIIIIMIIIVVSSEESSCQSVVIIM